MGRLTEAVVTHSRAQVPDAPGMPDPPDPPDIVRTTQFTYHANQRLATERVAMNVAISHSRSESRRIRDAASIDAGELDIRAEDNTASDDTRLLHLAEFEAD